MTDEADDPGMGISREGDVDLGALPRPKRTGRTVALALLVATALGSLALAFALRHEARFATARTRATDLGPFVTAEAAALATHDGEYVRVGVDLRERPTAVFDRPFDATRYRVTAVGPGRWVIYPVPPAVDGPRFIPPTLVAGRLVAVDDLGIRFRGLPAQMRTLVDGSAPSGWVVVDGEDPRTMGWIIALELLLLGFVGFSVVSLVRLLRPVEA
ncbi:MAG: hypothetical protein AAGN82_06250 [Myxococcota bacterium]